MNDALKKCADAVASLGHRMDAMLTRRDAKTPVDKLVSSLNAALSADRYVTELSNALGDENKFPMICESLKGLPVDVVKEVCLQLTGARATSKVHALKKIWNMHQGIMSSRARIRANGGRSAA